jgi:hypothetical protein
MRTHVLRLIAEGYTRMDKSRFADEQEPSITGALVERMREFLEEDADAPSWCAFYSINDDPPLNVTQKQGKSRPRVDIEFERVACGKRPRLRFEAKRLNSATGHTVSGYLGKDGLGCFLSGKYPLTHAEAGMLGYVQSDDETTWAKRIASVLSRDRNEYAVEEPLFCGQAAPAGLAYTYLSHHHSKAAPHTTIHHVLLRFEHLGE